MASNSQLRGGNQSQKKDNYSLEKLVKYHPSKGWYLTLTLSLLSILILRPMPEVTYIILTINVILYFLLRRWLGNWIQKKLFMSLDFHDASIHSINKAKKEIFWERNPIYFIKTIIS